MHLTFGIRFWGALTMDEQLIVVCAGVVLIVVVVMMMWLFKARHHSSKKKHASTEVSLLRCHVFNDTNLPYTVVCGKSHSTYKVSAGAQISFACETQEILTARPQQKTSSSTGSSTGFSASGVLHTITIPDTASGDLTLHLTNSGFRYAHNVGKATFVNTAQYPVMFIEVHKHPIKKWATDIVPPGSTSAPHIIAKGSMWQVSHPTTERIPIATVTVGGIATKLTFDGVHLVAS